ADPQRRAVGVVAGERERALVEPGGRLRGVHVVRLVAGTLEIDARLGLRLFVGTTDVAREKRGALEVVRDEVVELALLPGFAAHTLEPGADGSVLLRADVLWNRVVCDVAHERLAEPIADLARQKRPVRALD